jgi:hypothetical protein
VVVRAWESLVGSNGVTGSWDDRAVDLGIGWAKAGNEGRRGIRLRRQREGRLRDEHASSQLLSWS